MSNILKCVSYTTLLEGPKLTFNYTKILKYEVKGANLYLPEESKPKQKSLKNRFKRLYIKILKIVFLLIFELLVIKLDPQEDLIILR